MISGSPAATLTDAEPNAPPTVSSPIIWANRAFKGVFSATRGSYGFRRAGVHAFSGIGS